MASPAGAGALTVNGASQHSLSATTSPEPPWCLSSEQVAQALGTDLANGLDSPTAARKLAQSGPNAIPTEQVPSLTRLVLSQLRDTMILVLLGAGLLTLITGDFADTVIILLVVAVNATVGVIQERRAQGAVEALRTMAAPSSVVRRDGISIEIPAAGVVRGDVLVLTEGDIVAADARLFVSDDLEVDESLLTGESMPVARTVAPLAAPEAPIAERLNMVHGGTLVLHGRGSAIVLATGADSAIGSISTLLQAAKAPITPLQRRLTRLGRMISIAAVAGCSVVAVLGLLRGQPWDLVLITAIGLAVAAIPESLPAVVALALASGSRRMAKRGAIVRTLAAVETLGSATVLASDKTGTLTTGDMVSVAAWTVSEGEQNLPGAGESPGLDAVIEGAAPGARALMSAAALCCDADLRGNSGVPTELALLRGANSIEDVELTGRAHPRLSEIPFDRDRRTMTTTHRGPLSTFSITKGAPEAVLHHGAAAASPLHEGSRPDESREALRVAGAWAASGRRVIAVALASGRDEPQLLGLVAIADPVRPEAAAAIRACREAGITTVLITGDHPGTADAVARSTGLLGDDDDHHVIDEPAAWTEPRVYARADPGTKLRLINRWQQSGHVVAMTGDGANDAPALRAADIGVAMGRRGTDVARRAADVVLTDDSLSTVVAAVAEGRRVFDNIRRFVRYGLAGGLAEIAVMLSGPFLGMPLPLLAGQILWINLLTHGLPGVAIGAEAAEPDVLRRPPRPPDEPIMTRTLVTQIGVLGAALTISSLGAAAWTRHLDGPWQSVLFASLAAGQLGLALSTRSDTKPVWRLSLSSNRMLAAAVTLSVVLVLAGLYLPPLQALLRTQALSIADLVVVLLSAALPVMAAQVMVLIQHHASGNRYRIQSIQLEGTHGRHNRY